MDIVTRILFKLKVSYRVMERYKRKLEKKVATENGKAIRYFGDGKRNDALKCWKRMRIREQEIEELEKYQTSALGVTTYQTGNRAFRTPPESANHRHPIAAPHPNLLKEQEAYSCAHVHSSNFLLLISLDIQTSPVHFRLHKSSFSTDKFRSSVQTHAALATSTPSSNSRILSLSSAGRRMKHGGGSKPTF
ncbi:hypothetical protein OWV82_011166 [Melia azedarach]|uniref:Uncharacterized protein n=1 Tax=Melia azedarach TaxID=155640 RepID=A0ACC1XY96_MELAZ|nr:hypothetical protein OWV82_011166 [Melia azedarach]